jgi:hypothetical protein
MNNCKHFPLRVTIVPVFFLLLAALMFFSPLAASFRTGTGVIVHAWKSRQLYSIFPILWLLLLTLTALAWHWTGRQFKLYSENCPRCLVALRPVIFLPLIVSGGYLAPWIGLTFSGLILPYGIALIGALIIENLVGDGVRRDNSIKKMRIFSWSVIAYGIFILVAGLYFTKKIGCTAGDEIHYLVQLESLISRSSLELSNEMAPLIAEYGHSCLSYSHVKENLEGKRYSYHSFGLPILAWPFGYLGVFGRQLILAIIAALAAAGCRAICLEVKAAPKFTSILTWALALSYIWAMYSIRFLPEILGCGLVAWGCWALVAQNRKRWTATIVAAICCGFLPYAHIRWAPASLVIAAFLGLEGLFIKGERLRSKFIRLLTFSIIYAAFGLMLLSIHARLYSGSQAYSYEKVFLSYPLAMWGMFIDRRGLFGLLPVLLWFVVSIPYVCTMGKRAALRALESATILVATLITSCSTAAALQGVCIPGRYLLTAMPALLAPAALALSRCNRAARIWLYYLASMPVLFYIFVGSWMRGSHISFFRVPEKLRGYIGFHTYWEPLPSLLQGKTSEAIVWASLFILGLMLFTALLFAFHRRPRLISVVSLLVLITAFAFGFKSDRLENSSGDTGIFLLSKDRDWNHFFIKPHVEHPEIFATLTGQEPDRADPLTTLSDRIRTAEDPYSFMSSSELPGNDWAGRKNRWHVIRPNQIRHNFDGSFAFRVSGHINRGSVRFAVLQGSHLIEDDLLLGEGDFDFTWIVRTKKGRGFTQTLMSLEDNTGEVVVNFIQLAPYSPHMMSSGFSFPPSTQVRDLTDIN